MKTVYTIEYISTHYNDMHIVEPDAVVTIYKRNAERELERRLDECNRRINAYQTAEIYETPLDEWLEEKREYYSEEELAKILADFDKYETLSV